MSTKRICFTSVDSIDIRAEGNFLYWCPTSQHQRLDSYSLSRWSGKKFSIAGHRYFPVADQKFAMDTEESTTPDDFVEKWARAPLGKPIVLVSNAGHWVILKLPPTPGFIM